jgi:hypothetical protein
MAGAHHQALEWPTTTPSLIFAPLKQTERQQTSMGTTFAKRAVIAAGAATAPGATVPD